MAEPVGPEDVLFVAQSAGASCYHRIMLPAVTLGCDWCGLDSPPPLMTLGRGEVRFREGEPDLSSYACVVVQTPAQEGWLELIPKLQAGGTKVIYEVDYLVHEIAEDEKLLGLVETLIGMCDGLICSTQYIAERYAQFNPKTFLCENGLDLRAYRLTRPPHDTVNIGWSGTTLLPDEMMPWLVEIGMLMRARPQTNFVSIGIPFADALADMKAVEPERCLTIPGMLPEQVPAAMSFFDVAIDPAGRHPWRRGRSQLRWLETGAWGIPLVGDSRIYPGIEDGVTGLNAADPVATAQAVLRLVDDPLLRSSLGQRAKEIVHERYSMEAMAPRWAYALDQVLQ